MASTVDQSAWRKISQTHFARVADRYDGGRAFEQGEFWAAEIARRIELSSADRLLDVGCGTGLFALAFQQALPCAVFGIDPAAAMLTHARAKPHGARVAWTQNGAEAVCFASETFRAIFLSQVWHHLADSACAAREFQRLLQPGGALLIKTFSHAQLRERWDLTVVFPELLPFMLAIYPDVADFDALLQNVGFARITHTAFRKEDGMCPSALLRIAEEKLWSMFAYLSADARARGIAYLRELIATTNDAPVPCPEVHWLVCAEK